jgi:hypothetical protein
METTTSSTLTNLRSSVATTNPPPTLSVRAPGLPQRPLCRAPGQADYSCSGRAYSQHRAESRRQQWGQSGSVGRGRARSKGNAAYLGTWDMTTTFIVPTYLASGATTAALGGPSAITYLITEPINLFRTLSCSESIVVTGNCSYRSLSFLCPYCGCV